MSRYRPGQTLDQPLEFSLINGTKWSPSSQTGNNKWAMVVVYRGLHCPVCKSQLRSLEPMLEKFADAGVAVISASMDSEDRANKAYDKWELGNLPVAYDMPREIVENFGLFLSDAVNDDEPEQFSEPAILLFKGNTYHAAWFQTLPFARPQFEDVLSGIKFINENDYPARGTAAVG